MNTGKKMMSEFRLRRGKFSLSLEMISDHPQLSMKILGHVLLGSYSPWFVTEIQQLCDAIDTAESSSRGVLE